MVPPLDLVRYLPYPACWMVTVPLSLRDAAFAGSDITPNIVTTTSSIDSRRAKRLCFMENAPFAYIR